jgi:hypothetical protein
MASSAGSTDTATFFMGCLKTADAKNIFMNIFFASAVFKQPIKKVAVSVLPALLAIFVGTLIISWLPIVAIGLPEYLGQMAQ